MKKKTAEYQRDEYLPTITEIFTKVKWFGIPVYGGKIAFWWAVSIFFMLLATVIGALWKLIRLLLGWATSTSGGRGFTARFSGTVFYGNGLASFILCWRLLSSWKQTFFIWSRAETTTGLYFPPDMKIRKRVIFVTCFVAVCASVEHIMSMVSSVGENCTIAYAFQRYILNSHAFLLQPSEFSYWIGIPIFVVSKVATILWNFQDLVIILISMGLSSRYHRLNLCVHKVVNYERKARATKFGTDIYIQIYTWRKLREAYVRQAALVRRVDKELGPLVVLSNINNFYFICLQLFLGINQSARSASDSVYYFISLGWLLFRASSVVLAAADVNLHSKKALTFIYSRIAYNVEIKRLKNQLSNENIALSGMGFFVLERKVLLQVAAAIIKYELVLLQFDN